MVELMQGAWQCCRPPSHDADRETEAQRDVTNRGYPGSLEPGDLRAQRDLSKPDARSMPVPGAVALLGIPGGQCGIVIPWENGICFFPFYSAKSLASSSVALPGVIYGGLSPHKSVGGIACCHAVTFRLFRQGLKTSCTQISQFIKQKGAELSWWTPKFCPLGSPPALHNSLLRGVPGPLP